MAPLLQRQLAYFLSKLNLGFWLDRYRGIELYHTNEGDSLLPVAASLIVLAPSDGGPRDVGHPGAKQDEALMFAAGCGLRQGVPAV